MSFLYMSGGVDDSHEAPPLELYSADADALVEGRMLGEGSYGSVFVCRPRSASDGPGNLAIKIVPLYGKNPTVGLTSREEQLNADLRQEIEIMQLLTSNRTFVPKFTTLLLAHQETHLEGAGHLRMLFAREHSNLQELIYLYSLDEHAARFYAGCVIEALCAAHSLGIVHRDCKPDNILVSEDGYVKLGDWGCSRILKSCVIPAVEPSDICTPAYRAPEIWRPLLSEAQRQPQARVEMPYDRAIDLWSLGTVCLELITGRDLLLDRPQRQVEEEEENRSEQEYSETAYRRCVNEMRAYIQAGGLLQHAASRSDRVWAQRLLSSTGEARSLLCALMTVQPSGRLGMSADGVDVGFALLRDHNWFAGFDWEALRARSMAPPTLFSIDHSNDWVRTHLNADDDDSISIASAVEPAVAESMLPAEAQAPKRNLAPVSPSQRAVRQKRSHQHAEPGMADSSSRLFSLAEP